MSESNAWKTLRKEAFKPGDRVDRIENAVGAGFPDVNGCLRTSIGGAFGSEFWIEIKAPKEPKRASTPLFGSNHKLSAEQKNWFLRQLKAGGRAFIYIETETKRMLLHGACAERVNDMTVQQLLDAAVWKTTKPTRNKEVWDGLRHAIIDNVPF